MANVTPQSAQKFLQLLKQDLGKTDQLLQYLEAEKSAIEARDFDAYNKLLNNKKQLLIEIEGLERERQTMMQQMEFSADKEGFQQFLNYVPSSWKARFEDLWQSLSDKLNRCRDLNQINGKILLHAQIATERLMQLMKGVAPNQMVYRPNGRTSMLGNQRTIATA